MQKKSYGSARTRFLNRERIEEAILRYAQRIAGEYPEILKIVLFGSFANGVPTPKSDVDILVVLKESTLPFHLRMAQFLDPDFPLDMEIFPYTKDELALPFARHALKEGKVIFARE